MPLDLPHLTGQIPHAVEQAILRLREAIEQSEARTEAVISALSAMPPPLTLPEIQAALSPTGAFALPVSGISGTQGAQTSPVPLPPVPPGQVIPNAYAAICPDGTQVVGTAPNINVPATIQFGTDAPIALATPVMFLQAMSGSFGHLAIFKANIGGHAILVNRTGAITDLGPTHGNYPVGLRTNGVAVWQDTDSTYKVAGFSTPIPPAYVGTSQGFLALDAAGDPVWTDEQFITPIVIDGVTFYLASRDGDWTVGQSGVTYDYIAYKHSTSTMYVAGPTLNSPIAPRVAQQADGSCILARSLPSGWFPSSGFTLYNIPAPLPADAIDLSTVIFIPMGVSAENWTRTSEITSAVSTPPDLCIDHTQEDLWPEVPLYGDTGDLVYGNQWLIAFIGADWYAGPANWLRRGVSCDDYSTPIGATWFPGTDMETWDPLPGETVYVFVSCPARGGQWSLSERSNVVAVTW